MVDNEEIRILPVLQYLKRVILAEFGHLVETVYIGDVGMYPPSAFRDAGGSHKLAVRIVLGAIPDADPRQRTPMGEVRTVSFDIIPMVNMVPHFEATPVEAFGELELVEFIDMVFEYFRRTTSIDLGGYAATSRISSIDFGFEERGELSIRAARIRLDVKLEFDNLG